MIKELILGTIPDDFDPTKHIGISPTCFIGKEEIYTDFESFNFVNAYKNTTELSQIDNLTSSEALALVSLVAKKYNPEIYDKFSFLFWKTIYFPFLGLFIPWLYRKQILIEKVINKYSQDNLKVSFSSIDHEIVFVDEFQLIIDGLWNPQMNEYVLSQILELQTPKKWETSRKRIVFASDEETITRFKRKTGYKTKLVNLLHKYFYRSYGIFGFSYWNEIYFHLLLSIKPKLKHSIKKTNDIDFERIDWKFDIELFIDKFLPTSLRNIDVKLFNSRKYKRGKIHNYSSRLYYDIHSKIDAALAYESGGIVITTQHGGHNYGSAFTFEYGKIVEYCSDYFISWGSYQIPKNSGITIPLASPLLSNYANTHATKNSRIIIVGTDMNLFLSRFDSTPNEGNWLKYRKNKLLLIENISNSNVWYRPYFKKGTSLLDWEYLNGRLKYLNKLEGDLHSELKSCRLLILDHPGTTWYIAMAMNTPMICTWERNHFPFNEEADNWLNKFKHLGIYFENAENAAIKVNKLESEYEDLSEWWNQNEIQELRNEWMNVYARASKKWFRIWTKALWKLK
jgi:putative transferase (TIGR04331 family)